MVIRRIEPASCAMVGGTLYALLGLVFGICFSLVALGGAGLSGLRGYPFGGLFGVGAIIVLPIVYGIFGFIFMFIAAFLYNVAAKIAGGLVIQVE